MDRQKGVEIALGDPHGTTEAVAYELKGFDPAANGPGRNMKTLRDLGDGEKYERSTDVATRPRSTDPTRLAVIMGRAVRNLATTDVTFSGHPGLAPGRPRWIRRWVRL